MYQPELKLTYSSMPSLNPKLPLGPTLEPSAQLLIANRRWKMAKESLRWLMLLLQMTAVSQLEFSQLGYKPRQSRCGPTHPSTRTLCDEAAQRRLCQTLGRSMQGLACYAELLGSLFVVIGIPSALYCVFGALVQRDFKQIVGVLVSFGIWLAVFILRLQVVPGGEVRSSQYSGVAGLMQILFFVASAALLVSSIKTLRQQMKGSK